MRTRCSLLIPSVALAAALTACGDSGVTKSDFTAKADGSCFAGNSAMSAMAKPSNAPQVATAAGTATSTLDGQVGALRAMKMPSGGDETAIQGVIGAIGEVGGSARALQEAAAKNDEPAMAKAAAELQTKTDTAATQGQMYGLTHCGSGLKPAVANLFEGTKSMLKTSYVTKGEAACRDAGRKAGALPQPGANLPAVSRYFDNYLPITTKLLADLKALPTPPGDEPAVTEMTAAFDSTMVRLKEFGAAAKANNPRLLAALSQELDLAFTSVNAKFDAYGMKACGSLSEF